MFSRSIPTGQFCSCVLLRIGRTNCSCALLQNQNPDVRILIRPIVCFLLLNRGKLR